MNDAANKAESRGAKPRMQIRGLILAVFVTVLGPLFAEMPAAAQESSPVGPVEEPRGANAEAASDPTGEASADIETDADAGVDTDADVVEYEEPRADPYAPPTGMEERVVLAGESDAAGDLSAGDSIAGFDASDLDALGALSIADLGKFTPNLEIVTAGATSPTFFIRGVGLNDFNSNSAGAVAVYQDEVAMNSPALQLSTLFDMERVNVLRGPVGSGPFRNASAGAIKLYSRKPTGDYNGYLRSSFGNFASRDFEGAVEAPIYQDILSARVAFRVTQRDGYVTNGCGGAPPRNERRKRAFVLDDTIVDVGSNPLWSICGENVKKETDPSRPDLLNPRDGASDIPAGLPEKVNDLGNWAARATFRFQPTLDMDFLINAHGARRDQYSTQGISYGVGKKQKFPDGSEIRGRLGGPDGAESTGYVKPEVLYMARRLAAILERDMTPKEALNAANLRVADELAQNLDSNPYRADYNRVGKTKSDVWGGYIQGDIALPLDLMFHTVSAFDAYDRFIDADTDQSPNPLFEIKTDDEGWQFFQDLGLHGALSDDSNVSWDVGGFYLMEKLTVNVSNFFGDNTALTIRDRTYVQKLWSFAVYGSLSWSILDDLTLDGGVRYNSESKQIDFKIIRAEADILDFQERTRSAPTADVRLTYNFREDTHAYWKYTRGWKGGHFNATSSLTDGVSYAEPETNNAFEVGLRGNWFDSRLQLDADFFYYDYNNYQLFTVDQKGLDLPEFVVINASNVEVLGVEADVSGRPWNGAFAMVRFSWLESSFTDFVQTQTITESVGGDGRQTTREIELNFSGNRLLNSPQFKLSLTGEQTVPLGRYGSLTARYDAAWTDTTFFDATEGRGLPNSDRQIFLPEDTIGQRAYWLHNALVIYRPPVGSFELHAWVRNFTGEAYKSFGFDASGFQNTTIYFVGEPRMFGGTLLINF